MKRTFTFTKRRLIGFLCWSLLPTLAIIFGIMILTYGVRLNYGFALAFILPSLITIGLLALLMFSNCKNMWKVIVSVVFLVCFAISFWFLAFITPIVQVKHYEGDEVKEHYNSVCDENPQMPQLSEIGQPTNVESYYVFHSAAIFASEIDYLICCYTPEAYAAQKAALDEKYVFQTETITENESNCEPSAQVDGFEFRILSIEEYDLYYPKQVILIGYSDDDYEIVYASYCDWDLDYISSLQNFIISECGWKYIR